MCYVVFVVGVIVIIKANPVGPADVSISLYLGAPKESHAISTIRMLVLL